MRSAPVMIAPWLALWVVSATACMHGARLENGTWHAEHTSFRVGSLGPDWERHESDADVAFYQAQLDAMILANSDCNARADAPLSVAGNTLLIGFTDRQIVREERVNLDGREALHRELRAKLDGVPLAIDSFVLKKDGCLYDLVLLAPPATAGRGAADFARFVGGFATEEGTRVAGRGAHSR